MENIKVSLRLRPLSLQEQENKDENVWRLDDPHTIEYEDSLIHPPNLGLKQKKQKVRFQFDQVYGPSSKNEDVYRRSAREIVMQSLQGVNATIFMYGQTGAGKTYSMIGKIEDTRVAMPTNPPLPRKQSTATLAQSVVPRQSIYHSNTKNEEAMTQSRMSVGNRPRDRSGRKDSRRNWVSPGQKSESREKRQWRRVSISPPRQKAPEYDGARYQIKEITGESGVLIQSLKGLLEGMERQRDKTFLLWVEYVEIYNEKIYDLLGGLDQLDTPLQITEDSHRKEFFIRNTTAEETGDLQEMLRCLERGEANRHYAATAMNRVSSRSHTLFRVHVQAFWSPVVINYPRESNINHRELLDALHMEPYHTTEALLNFVDLAGSEKVSNHYQQYQSGQQEEPQDMVATRDRVQEGKYINSSLFFLTLVIQQHSKGPQLNNKHVPYRNSPLTKLLSNSLGGNSKTLLLLCITPASSQYDQTLSTLRFGQSAKTVQNVVQKNLTVDYKLVVQEQQDRIAHLESQLARSHRSIDASMPENHLSSLSHPDHQALHKEIQDLQTANADLSAQLLSQKKNYEKQVEELKNQVDSQQFFSMGEYKEHLKGFEKVQEGWNWEDSCHLPQVGLLQLSSQQRQQHLQHRLSRPKLHAHWQDLLYDSQGRLVLKAYKKQKQIYRIYQNIIEDQNILLRDFNEKIKLLNREKEDIKIYVSSLQADLDRQHELCLDVLTQCPSQPDPVQDKSLEQQQQHFFEELKRVNEQLVLRKYNLQPQMPSSLYQPRLSTIAESKETHLPRLRLKQEHLILGDLQDYAKEAAYRIDKEYSLNVKDITQQYLRQEANRLQLKVKEIKDMDSHIQSFLTQNYQDFLNLIQKKERQSPRNIPREREITRDPARDTITPSSKIQKMQQKSAQLQEDFQRMQQEEQQVSYSSIKQSGPMRNISIDEEIQNLKNLQMKVNKTFTKTTEKKAPPSPPDPAFGSLKVTEAEEQVEESEDTLKGPSQPAPKQFRYNNSAVCHNEFNVSHISNLADQSYLLSLKHEPNKSEERFYNNLYVLDSEDNNNQIEELSMKYLRKRERNSSLDKRGNKKPPANPRHGPYK